VRLFLAVDVDAAVRAALAGILADLRTEMRAWDPPADGAVKWADPRHLHITLRFLGEVPDSGVPVLRQALAAPFPCAPFPLGLGGLGVFPPSGPARVIWIGCGQGEPDLAALARCVRARLAGISTAADDRPFSAHLTLCRFRVSDRRPVRARLAALPPPQAGTCTISTVALYQSRLTSAGPDYTVVTRTPLEP
jgi:RNA 2',3'-cyclic 3'-phosphodiesterase